MNKFLEFVKKTRWVSRILTILWLATSYLLIDNLLEGNPDSFVFGTVMFLLPVLLIEIGNPVFKASNTKIIFFLSHTKGISRVLFGIWLLFCIFSPNTSSDPMVIIVFGILLLSPAAIIEMRKNPACVSIRFKRKEVVAQKSEIKAAELMADKERELRQANERMRINDDRKRRIEEDLNKLRMGHVW